MEKIKSKGGRPKSDNPRTVVSEIYLTTQEAEELKAAGKKYGYSYLSQFLRNAAFHLIDQQVALADAKSSIVSAHLGSLASDISSLNDICSRPGMPESAFLISDSVKSKIIKLHQIIHNNNNNKG